MTYHLPLLTCVFTVPWVLANQTTSTTEKPTEKSGLSDSDWKFLITGSVVGIILIILICVLLCCCRKKSRQNEHSLARTKSSTPSNFEQDILNQYERHLSNSMSDTSLVNMGFESSSPKTKPNTKVPMKTVGKSMYISKPYGEMGESAASPFIGPGIRNKRLCSITTISPTSSFNGSIDQQLSAEMRRASCSTISSYTSQSRRDSSFTPQSRRDSNFTPQSRRDSGYVAVNITKPPVAKKRLYSSGAPMQQRTTSSAGNIRKQTSLTEECEPYLTHDLNIPKAKSRAKSNIEATDSSTFELFRHASTGQALDYCVKAKKDLPKTKKEFTTLKRQESNNNNNDDSSSDHDYTDLNELNEKDGYLQASDSPRGHLDANGGYMVAYQHSTASKRYDGDMTYEVPQDVFENERVKQSQQYSNLNAAPATDYQNFDYSVPLANSTQTDEEDVYMEFIPENKENNTTKM